MLQKPVSGLSDVEVMDKYQSLQSLNERNNRAAGIIQDYATNHAIADVTIGVVGTFIPIPGLATAALLGAVAMQFPIYQSLAGKLATIYTLKPDNVTIAYAVTATTLGGVNLIAMDYATEFGTDFLKEAVNDLLSHTALGVVGSAIPFIGGAIAAGLDAAIAATMTWTVGSMTAIYFQNGQQWLGSKKKTFEVARNMVGTLSPEIDGRVDLKSISHRFPEIHERQVQALERWIEVMQDSNSALTKEQIRSKLIDRNIPRNIVDDAVRNKFGMGLGTNGGPRAS